MEAKAQGTTQPEISDAEAQEHESDYVSDENLTAIDRQYAAQTNLPSRRIHIIGTGAIGKLVAHALRGIANPPPITLIFHRYPLLKAWENSPKEITIQDNGFDVPRSGFDVELMPVVLRQHGVEIPKGSPNVYDFPNMRPDEAAKMLKEDQLQQKEDELRRGDKGKQDTMTQNFSPLGGPTRPNDADGPVEDANSVEPIYNLVLTTKAAYTISALSALRHRLLPTSTICFLQNGMGIIDEVNKEIFPDPATRPNYIQGIITHGANVPPEKGARDPFYAVHAGQGTIALALLPKEGLGKQTITADVESTSDVKDVKTKGLDPTSRYMLRTLTRSPVLCAVGFTPTELLQQQLEKLAVNSVLNPLTALIDNRNGYILYNYHLTRTMRLLLAETSHVIRNLPELQSVPNVNVRFGSERLETICVSVAQKTKDNISSMLADVRAGKQTEIEYINGYIVRRGEEMGIKCVVNYAIMQTVLGKSLMTQRDERENVPLEGQQKRKLSGE